MSDNKPQYADQLSFDAFLDADRYNVKDYDFTFRQSKLRYTYRVEDISRRRHKSYSTANLAITYTPPQADNAHSQTVDLKFIKDTGRLVSIATRRGVIDMTQQQFDPDPGSSARYNTRFARDVKNHAAHCITEFNDHNRLIYEEYFKTQQTADKLFFDCINVKDLMTTLSDVFSRDDKTDLCKRDVRNSEIPYLVLCFESNANDTTLKTETRPYAAPDNTLG